MPRGVYNRTDESRKNIAKATRKQWREGKHSGQSARMKNLWANDDGSLRKAVSEGVSKRLKEDWKNQEYREKIIKALRKIGKISKPQLQMFRLVKTIFKDAKLEHYEKTVEKSYHVDIVIPSKKIAIEVDGRYWHRTKSAKKKDSEKTFELWNSGWKVYRIEAERVKKQAYSLIIEILEEQIYNLDLDFVTLDIILSRAPSFTGEKYACSY